MNLENGGAPVRTWGYLATGNYFDVLGVKPALGRFFHQAEDQHEGGAPFAVLSYDCWTGRDDDHHRALRAAAGAGPCRNP
jgi:hypothetical protein